MSDYWDINDPVAWLYQKSLSVKQNFLYLNEIISFISMIFARDEQ